MGDKENEPASDVVTLPAEAVRDAVETGRSLEITIARRHSGPFPDPQQLAAYREIVPDLPEVLVREFQSEARHRRRTQTTSQIGAIAIALAAVIGGIWLSYSLKSHWAALWVIGPVCGVLGIAQFIELYLKIPKK
jgi:hypothetical protein